MMEARQLPLPFDEPLGYEAADFIEAASNAAARAALARKQDWVNGRLVVWGEAGSGKTHLLRLWAAHEGAIRLNAPSLREPVQALEQDMAIEDIDAAASEPALLHTLNTAQAAGCHVLLTSRVPPGRLPLNLADLASRLRASLTIQIEPAEDALLEALLIRLCAVRQIILPAQLRNYLLTRLPRKAAVLHEAVARLDRAALALGASPTRAMASLVLAELCLAPEAPEPPLRERHSPNSPGFL